MNVQNNRVVRTGVGDSYGDSAEIGNIARARSTSPVSIANLETTDIQVSLGDTLQKAPTCEDRLAFELGADLTWDSPAFKRNSLLSLQVLQGILQKMYEKAKDASEEDRASIFDAFKLLDNEIKLRRRLEQHRMLDEQKPNEATAEKKKS